ncbi:MAG: NAD(P)H-hydrate dehydratase [Pseudomonadales bacterium]
MKLDNLIPVDVDRIESGAIVPRAFTAAQVREIDRVLIEEQGIAGLTLMKRAAAASIQLLKEIWPNAKTIRVYCGSGNNAGDGYIIAGLLAEQHCQVEVVQVGDAAKLGADGQSAYGFCQQSAATLTTTAVPDLVPDVIVDALLGTGFKGAPRDHYAEAIAAINSSSAGVLAVDVPSGLALDFPQTSQQIVKANATVTFIALKQGMLTGAALDQIGALYLAPLADSADALPSTATTILQVPELRRALPARPRNAHKFRFGHVLMIGGDNGMGGAPLMSALAAMRCGAGLVSVATHPGHASQLVGLHPELMIRGVADVAELQPLLEAASMIAIGPGLGKSQWGQAMFAAALASEVPLVVDADGLNLLAQQPVSRGNWILTPHPGEAERLLGESLPDRFSAATRLQQKYDGVVVLKGAGTLVAEADQISLCPYGNPGMSTAGMGDVLCGVIAGLLGQCQDIVLAAKLGTALHSSAADHLVRDFGTRGLLATDLIPEVRRLLNDV